MSGNKIFFLFILFITFCLTVKAQSKLDSPINPQTDSTKREMISLPQPLNTTDSVGIVVIKVAVNREGNVVSAEFVPEKSTTTNNELIENAKNAALKAKFTKNDQAPAIQTGHIKYKFELR